MLKTEFVGGNLLLGDLETYEAGQALKERNPKPKKAGLFFCSVATQARLKNLTPDMFQKMKETMDNLEWNIRSTTRAYAGREGSDAQEAAQTEVRGRTKMGCHLGGLSSYEPCPLQAHPPPLVNPGWEPFCGK